MHTDFESNFTCCLTAGQADHELKKEDKLGMEIHKLHMFYTILWKSDWIFDTEDLLQVKSRSPR